MRFHQTVMLGMAAVLAIPLAGCGEEAAAPPSAPRPIAWTEVVPAEDGTIRTLSGVVRAIQRAPLSFEVAGRIDTLGVDIGDHFDAGIVLASLDPRTFELELAERTSELAEAEATEAEAASEYERQRRLFQSGWVSEAAYDRALAALETARSRVRRLEAGVAIARENLADTELVAPYEGLVGRRLAEPSQQVASGEPVLEIQGNGGGLEVVVSAPETLVDRLTIGSRHRISLPANDAEPLDGVITEIGAEATDLSAFPVTVALIDAPGHVHAGMTAEVAFALDGPRLSADFLQIPVAAFLAGTGPDDQVAFVYDAQSGTVSRRSIVVADIAENRALVADGLRPGDIVATAGLAFLSDGQAVTLLGEGPARYNM